MLYEVITISGEAAVVALGSASLETTVILAADTLAAPGAIGSLEVQKPLEGTAASVVMAYADLVATVAMEANAAACPAIVSAKLQSFRPLEGVAVIGQSTRAIMAYVQVTFLDAPKLRTRLVEPDRITSYNVCYTKLLRCRGQSMMTQLSRWCLPRDRPWAKTY